MDRTTLKQARGLLLLWWWCTPFPALGRLRQDYMTRARRADMVISYLKKTRAGEAAQWKDTCQVCSGLAPSTRKTWWRDAYPGLRLRSGWFPIARDVSMLKLS